MTIVEEDLTEVFDIVADRVSAVRKAANGAKFIMMKGADEAQAATIAAARQEAKLEKAMGTGAECPLCSALGTDMGGDKCALCGGGGVMTKEAAASVIEALGENPEEWVKEYYGLEIWAKGDFTADERKKMAADGVAMADGSYPIPNVQYLKKAIRAVGLGKNNSHGAIRRHIIKRARALNATNLIPASWGTSGPAKKEGMPDFASVGAYDISEDPDIGGTSVGGGIPAGGAANSGGSGNTSDVNVPGSAGWEANDSASMAEVALVLAQCDKALAGITQREQIEVVAGEADDVADVEALNCATSLLESALGIVARLSFGEAAAALMKSEQDLPATAEGKIRFVKEQLEQLLRTGGTVNQEGSGAAPTEKEGVISMEMTKEELAETVATTVDTLLEKRESARVAAEKERLEKEAADKTEEDRINAEVEARVKERLEKAEADKAAASTDTETEEQKTARLEKEAADTAAASGKTELELLREQNTLLKSALESPAGGGPFVGAGAGGAGSVAANLAHPRAAASADKFSAQRSVIQKGEAEGRDMTTERQELGRTILATVYEARGYSGAPVVAGVTG